MLNSSLGFHTMALSLSLFEDNATKLVMDFGKYREGTETMKIYRKNQEGKYITYRPVSDHIFSLPKDIRVYYPDGYYKGIGWHIYFSHYICGLQFYNIEAVINPKVLSRTVDCRTVEYLPAATYSDMETAILNFNRESKKISPLLEDFGSYKITRIDYCFNIRLDELVPECTPTAEQMMDLIKRSDVPYHYKVWMPTTARHTG